MVLNPTFNYNTIYTSEIYDTFGEYGLWCLTPSILAKKNPDIRHFLCANMYIVWLATVHVVYVEYLMYRGAVVVLIVTWSVLLVEEALDENHRPVASHWQTFSHKVVSSTQTDWMGSCKSNHVAMHYGQYVVWKTIHIGKKKSWHPPFSMRQYVHRMASYCTCSICWVSKFKLFIVVHE
jgi:hypothetical protein